MKRTVLAIYLIGAAVSGSIGCGDGVEDVSPAIVSLVSPAQGATVPRAVLPLLAMASDDVGVDQVEFLVDGVSQGISSAAPFSITWDASSATSGSSHTILAIATDEAGNVGHSQTVAIVIETSAPPEVEAPTVSVVSPAQGATVPQATVPLLAMATDNVGVAQVELFVDGVSQGATNMAPFSVSWDASAAAPGGMHTILAVASDTAGNVGYSQAVTVVIATAPAPETEPPTVSVVSPAQDAIVPQATVPLLAMATDNVGVTQVELFVDGVSQGTAPAPPFSASWDASAAAPGSAHTILAVATDAAGNVGYSPAVTIAIETATSPETEPPTVSIVSPAQGATVPQAVVPLLAMATDNVGVTQVELFVDGASEGVDSTAPFSVSWDASAAVPGSAHTILAIAADAAGNVGHSQTVTVVIEATPAAETEPPTVSIVAPAQGATVPRAVVSLLAMAADNVGVTQVELFVDGTSEGVASMEPFSASWDASAAVAGSAHTILAVATDAAGNVGYSQTVAVTIQPASDPDLIPPTVSIVSPVSGTRVYQALNTSVMAAAFDNVGVAKVELFADGSLLATDTSAPFSTNWSSSAAFGTQHSIYAVAYDQADNPMLSDVVDVRVAIPDYYITMNTTGPPAPAPVYTRDPINTWGGCSGLTGSSGFDLTWGPLPADCSVLRVAWENACSNGGTVGFYNVADDPANAGSLFYSSSSICFHCFNYSAPITLSSAATRYIRVSNPAQIISRIAVYCE